MLGNNWRFVLFALAVCGTLGISSALDGKKDKATSTAAPSSTTAASPATPSTAAPATTAAPTTAAPTTVAPTTAAPSTAAPTTAATTSSTTTKATPARQQKVNCMLQDFVDTADDCCSKPLEDIFPLETTQKECNKKQSKNGDNLLNGVMLNKLQDSRKNNQLDYSGKLFGPGVCFADCIFKSNNLMSSSGAVDFEKVREYLMKGRSDPWKSILSEAVSICKNYTDATTVKDITFRENLKRKTCKTESVHVVQCLQAVIALNCPQDLSSSHDKYKKCTETVANIDSCVKFIDKDIGRTEYLKNYLKTKKN